MPSSRAEVVPEGIVVTVETWLDHDPSAWRLPGTRLGTACLGHPADAAVTRLHAAGVRCVRLVEPVRLCVDAPVVSALALLSVKEATARGMVVLWEAVCDDGCVERRLYHHLYPPRHVHGSPAEAADGWRADYHPARCLWRRGPGFVEVRDRRRGSLELLTVDEADHLAQVRALSEGVDARRLTEPVRGDFAEADLFAEHDGLAWWLPAPVRRWPFPALVV